MLLEELSNIADNLGMMPDTALQKFAAMHKDDPYIMALAVSESNRRAKARMSQAPQLAAQTPTVVDEEIAKMGGIAALPAQNLETMSAAVGGIVGNDYDMAVGYADGGMVERYQRGGNMSPKTLFEQALDEEGVTDPRERAFLRSLHMQESSGGKTAPTSNRGARGAMQILPGTFAEVADKDMDINDPFDNMRAGIRYARKGLQASGGDPELAGVYYYGGPGGMRKAQQGVAVSDPMNPNAPNTLQYGKQIAKRMTDLLPISSAQAATPQAASQTAPQSAAPTTGTPEGLEALGQRLDAARAAMRAGPTVGTEAEFGVSSPAMEENERLRANLRAAESEYQKYASTLGLDRPALAAPSRTRKSVVTTPTPVGQQIAKEVARPDIAAQEERARVRAEEDAKKAAAQNAPKDDGAYDRTETQKFITQAESARGAAANMSDRQKETVIKAAEKVVPDADKYGPEDLFMFGLNLMASQNRSFLGALGEAGKAVIGERRARKKEAREEEYRTAMIGKAKAETEYIKGGKGGSGRALKDILGAMSRADTGARQIAIKRWGDLGERQALQKEGFKTFDQYYSHLLQQERKRALPISGVSAVDDDEED